MARSQTARASHGVTEAQVVGKATVRAAALLDIPNNVLARIIGLSESSVSRLRAGALAPEPDQKAFELSVLFVRLFRGLDAIVGGDAASAKSWLRTENAALRGTPLILIQTVPGLMQVVQYVDARRARV